MKTARWLMVGALLGFLGSTTSSCGSTSKCGPSDCPFGCCDASGTCQPGSSDALCGAAGQSCNACTFPARCQLGTCATVGGSGGGSSSGGGGGTSMGGGGGTSMGGGGGTSMGGGGGTACGPSNCNGCCSSGRCIAPPGNTDNTTCGQSGNACVNCVENLGVCNAATFTCTPATGGGGGATGGGGGATGGGGGATGGGGGASCGPTTCTGCCAAGRCILPPANATPSTCGTGGQGCFNCTTTARVCNPSTFSCEFGTGGGGGATGGGAGGGTGGAGGGFAGGDTCASPAILPGPGLYVDSTAAAQDDYLFLSTATDCAASSSSGGGPDKVYRITVPGNATLNVVVTPAGWDATINLIDAPGSCLPPADGGVQVCLTGADDPEDITWTNPSASSVNVYVVVDAYPAGAGGDITIQYSFVP